jgi:tetratricopeptide (TPR) repeat protein
MIYTDLLSYLHSQDNFQKQYPEEAVYDDDEGYITFCYEIAKKWIINTLPLLSNTSSEKTAAKEDVIYSILGLHNKRSPEYGERDDLIYSYFLHFCGILPFLRFCGKMDRFGEMKSEGHLLGDTNADESLLQLRSYFRLKTREALNRDLDKKPLFEFLSIYIDIIRRKVKDRPTSFRRLKECLTNDEDNIIFDAIKREHKLMKELMEETPERAQIRKNLLQDIFPETNDKNIEFRNVIESVMQAKLARLYFIAGKMAEHKDSLLKALDKETGYPDNTFALVQQAHLIVDEATEYSGEVDDKDHYYNEERKSKKEKTLLIGTAEKKFERAIELIDHGQYKAHEHHSGEELFGYRIQFEAFLGLAYIAYKRGLYSKAKKKYEEAEEIARKFPEGGQQEYLLSILSIDRGRNDLDNGNGQSYKKAMEDFQSVIDRYHRYHKELHSIKQELGELAALAHNNRGVCYLSRGEDEKAEKEFKHTLDIDDSNSHARYNLGVFYYKKGEKDRALRLIQNAYYLDPSFAESEKAISNLDNREKGKNIGKDWTRWWFKKNDQNRSITNRRNRKSLVKLVIFSVLSILIVASFAKYSYDQLHDYGDIVLRVYDTHQHDVDENAFLVLIAVSLVILLLPVISKLNMGGVEIELESESAGSHAVNPSAVTVALSDDGPRNIWLCFFFPRYWY